MFEVLWSVQCEGATLNLASRRVGVDWATGRRWVEQLEARFARSGQLADLCSERHEAEIKGIRSSRLVRELQGGAQKLRESDEKWFLAAHAAEVLLRAQRVHKIRGDDYKSAFKELTARRNVGTDDWESNLFAFW